MSTFANGNAGPKPFAKPRSKKNQAARPRFAPPRLEDSSAESTSLLARPCTPQAERATTEGEAESGLVASQEFYKDWQCTRKPVTGIPHRAQHVATALADVHRDFEQRGGWPAMPNVVFATIHVTSISDIDQVNGKFTAQGSIHFRWFAPEYAHEPQGKHVTPKFVYDDGGFIIWSPNAVDLQLDHRNPIIARKFPHHAPGVLYTHVGWKGTFLTEFMLHSFPFDWQQLRMRFVFSDGAFAASPHHGTVFMPDYQYNPDLLSRCSHEWQYYVSRPSFPAWNCYEPQFTFMPETGAMYKGPCKQMVECKYIVQRKSRFYSTSILGTTALTSTLVLTAYSLKPTDISNRIAIGLTIVLTVQAIKFVMQQEMPSVPYLTFMDKYIWFNLALIFVACFLFALVPHLYLDIPTSDKWSGPGVSGNSSFFEFDSDEEAYSGLMTADFRCALGFVSIWAVVHLEAWIEIALVSSSADMGQLLESDSAGDSHIGGRAIWSW